MKKYDGISIRSYSSFREEARAALKGKWNIALVLFLALLFISGSFIGANFTYSTSEEISPYYQLEASIGPFTTLSYWRNGNLYQDAATGNSSPFVLPYNPLFVAAAALTTLMFLILTPISALGQTRLELNLLDGITPDFSSILHTSARKYWLCVRTELLVLWSIFWPMMLCVLAGMLLSDAIPALELLSIPLVLAGFVLLIVRFFSYAAAVYLVVTRPDMTARRALKASCELMKGRKWRYFCLGLSFFGWEALYGLLVGLLETFFGETLLMPAISLLITLAGTPLFLYIYTAQTAFLRDADSRTSGQPPVTDLVDALISSESGELPAPEAPAPSEETPDDPWANDEK